MARKLRYFDEDPNFPIYSRGKGFYEKKGKLKVLPDGRKNVYGIIYWSKKKQRGRKWY